MKFKRAQVRTTVRRPFVITAGLRVGYEGGTMYHPEQARQAIKHWVEARATAGQPYLTGVITECWLAYGHGQGRTANTGIEPAITFAGDTSVTALADLRDEEIEAILDNLAAHLGEALEQLRVEIAYCHKTWAIEAVA